MNFNGIFQRRQYNAVFHLFTDGILFFGAFLIGTYLRFTPEGWAVKFADYLPGLILGSIAFPCACYISALYSPKVHLGGMYRRTVLLSLCICLGVAVMLAMFYLNFSTRVGRGVMVISLPIAYLAAFLHHLSVIHWLQRYRERIAYLVVCPEDEAEIRLIRELDAGQIEFVGLIHLDSYTPSGAHKKLGTIDEAMEIVDREQIDRIVCSRSCLNDPNLFTQICHLRYSGVRVVPLYFLFEEINQFIPHDLISPEWFLDASGIPHVLYIKKLKRVFDIVVSVIGLFLAWPLIFLAMLLVKLTSPGPIFYRQVRCGRFGRPFEVIKLRTMRTDAEKDGVRWAAAKKDSRLTPVGGLLRKYRIDEIPQMINVLKGEMSFVGPRPERPEFVGKLARQIPYFSERHMIQPGITGWAQVCYPYGSSTADAVRKLEYDLFYMKHMSLFLDGFILLDTVRIVLMGGMDASEERSIIRNVLENPLEATPEPSQPELINSQAAKSA